MKSTRAIKIFNFSVIMLVSNKKNKRNIQVVRVVSHICITEKPTRSSRINKVNYTAQLADYAIQV